MRKTCTINKFFVVFAALLFLRTARFFAAEEVSAASAEGSGGGASYAAGADFGNGFDAAFDYDGALSAEQTWQRFSWNEDSPEFVLKYEVVIEARDAKSGGFSEVRRMVSESNSVRPDPLLPMGRYRFKIVTYNLLDVPSAQSDWTEFSVSQAFLPEIRNVSVQTNRTSTIYLDEYNDGVVSVGGQNLFMPETDGVGGPSTSYLLVGVGKKGARHVPKILNHSDNNRSLLLGFDVNSLGVGTYRLVATDASGLSSADDGRSRISVKFKKPCELAISVGYALPVILFDDTFRTYMNSSAWPMSGTARISFLPIKRRAGCFGLGISGSYTRMSNSGEAYSVDGNLILAHLNFVYQRPIKKRMKDGGFRRFMTLEAHCGAGGTYLCNYAFHFPHGVDSEPLYSLNFGFNAGAALHLYVTNRLYAEICADISVAIMSDMAFGVFLPSASVGWQF